MAISEAARADLYTGLTEVLGRERAETLMAYLPTFDPTDLATKGDIEVLRGDVDDLRREFRDLRGEFADLRGEFADLRRDTHGQITSLRGEFSDLRHEFGGLRGEFNILRRETTGQITTLRDEMDRRLLEINGRLDRLFHTLLAGMFVVIAAMIGLAVLVT